MESTIQLTHELAARIAKGVITKPPDTDEPWGIYDSKDKCWMGQPGNKGPNVYLNAYITSTQQWITGKLRAQMAAAIVNEQFRSGFRYRAKQYTEKADVFRDAVTAPVSFKKALNNLEYKADHDGRLPPMTRWEKFTGRLKTKWQRLLRRFQ